MIKKRLNQKVLPRSLKSTHVILKIVLLKSETDLLEVKLEGAGEKVRNTRDRSW